jgi:AcrR family transcriptional regulator
MPAERSKTPSTRRAILDATAELLFERGADQLTIRRVEERSGCRAPTIYHYFHDKTGLIDTLLEERCARLLAKLRRVPRRADPVEYLRELARAYIQFGLRNRTHYALISAPRRDSARRLPSAEAARRLVFRALEAAADAHGVCCDREAMFQAMWAVVHGVVSLIVSRPDHAWSPDLVDLALDTIERGVLRAEAGP